MMRVWLTYGFAPYVEVGEVLVGGACKHASILELLKSNLPSVVILLVCRVYFVLNLNFVFPKQIQFDYARLTQIGLDQTHLVIRFRFSCRDAKAVAKRAHKRCGNCRIEDRPLNHPLSPPAKSGMSKAAKP